MIKWDEGSLTGTADSLFRGLKGTKRRSPDWYDLLTSILILTILYFSNRLWYVASVVRISDAVYKKEMNGINDQLWTSPLFNLAAALCVLGISPAAWGRTTMTSSKGTGWKSKNIRCWYCSRAASAVPSIHMRSFLRENHNTNLSCCFYVRVV